MMDWKCSKCCRLTKCFIIICVCLYFLLKCEIRSKLPLAQQAASGQLLSFKESYAILNSTFSCDTSKEWKPLQGRVYWTVFAGRRDRLRLQVFLLI